MPSSGLLSHHTALVTGGASGIGRAVAQRLAADGARVLVLDRDDAGARQVADEVGGEHLTADLSEGDAIDALDPGRAGSTSSSTTPGSSTWPRSRSSTRPGSS